MQPWIEEALAAAGADTPVMLDNSGDPPVEQIAALAPHFIIAAYSGITEEQYALPSSIAPTVAYRGEAWSTPWQDVTRVVGKAIGKPAETATRSLTSSIRFPTSNSLRWCERAPLHDGGRGEDHGGIRCRNALSLRWAFPEYIKAVGEAAKVARN